VYLKPTKRNELFSAERDEDLDMLFEVSGCLCLEMDLTDYAASKSQENRGDKTCSMILFNKLRI
jgi:hypothetical protein